MLSRLRISNLKDVFFAMESRLEESNIRVVRGKIGADIIYGIEKDITYESMISGEFREPHFQTLVNLLLDEKSNCLDLGANLGSHTLRLARCCPKGVIYSFEPQSLVFQCLTLNIFLNNLSNVVTFNLAVDTVTGEEVNIEAFLTSVQEINTGYSRITKQHSNSKSLTISLDDLSFPKLDFIKMDIQGSELNALKGMKNLVLRDRPIIFFEVEDVHLEFRESSRKELFESFQKLRYIIYRIETVYPSDHLAIPIEKQIEIEAKFAKATIGHQMRLIQNISAENTHL